MGPLKYTDWLILYISFYLDYPMLCFMFARHSPEVLEGSPKDHRHQENTWAEWLRGAGLYLQQLGSWYNMKQMIWILLNSNHFSVNLVSPKNGRDVLFCQGRTLVYRGVPTTVPWVWCILVAFSCPRYIYIYLYYTYIFIFRAPHPRPTYLTLFAYITVVYSEFDSLFFI